MLKILIIDDDDSLRALLSIMLTRMGYTVTEAQNGQEGLTLFKNARADIVITDIIMPGKEGFEVLMALRKVQPPVKIIAMTGDRGSYRAADNLRIAKFMGASQLLEKPFTRQALVAAIDELNPPSLPAHDHAGECHGNSERADICISAEDI